MPSRGKRKLCKRVSKKISTYLKRNFSEEVGEAKTVENRMGELGNQLKKKTWAETGVGRKRTSDRIKQKYWLSHSPRKKCTVGGSGGKEQNTPH